MSAIIAAIVRVMVLVMVAVNVFVTQALKELIAINAIKSFIKKLTNRAMN
jgi:hypothetical protein